MAVPSMLNENVPPELWLIELQVILLTFKLAPTIDLSVLITSTELTWYLFALTILVT